MFNGLFDHTQRSYNRARLIDYPALDFAQWEWEIEKLFAICAYKCPTKLLEVGTYQGGTLYGWLKCVQPPAHVFTVDDNAPLDFWQTWIPEGVALTCYQGNSHAPETLASVTENAPYDFLFIDADHTYEGVKQDFNDYGKLVKPGGVIALHDILDPVPERNQSHIQVSRLWKEIQQAGYVTQELISHPGQAWGGIGVVYL